MSLMGHHKVEEAREESIHHVPDMVNVNDGVDERSNVHASSLDTGSTSTHMATTTSPSVRTSPVANVSNVCETLLSNTPLSFVTPSQNVQTPLESNSCVNCTHNTKVTNLQKQVRC